MRSYLLINNNFNFLLKCLRGILRVRKCIVEVSVLAGMIVFGKNPFAVGPKEQSVCHSQGNDVIEFGLLRIGTQIDNLAAVQRYG